MADKLDNLKPFKKGDPDGRASAAGKKSSNKGVPHSRTRLKRLLELTNNMENPISGEVENFTVAEQLDLEQIIKAKSGDTAAYREIMDRLEGRPKQEIEHGGDQANPIRMILDKYGNGGLDELPESTQGSSEDTT